MLRTPIWNALLKRVSLLFASALLTLIAGESVLRLMSYDPLRYLRSNREQIIRPSPFPDMVYELTPGASGVAWDTPIEINDHGHRGHPGVLGKYPGHRTIVLGDSVTFGIPLPVESTFPYQLEQILNERGKKFEVLNLGVGGYDTLQEVALLEHRLLDYQPDLVIVGYCLNDLGVVSTNVEYIERLRQYQSNPLFRLRLAQFVASRIDRLRTANWMDRKNSLAVFRRDNEGQIAAIGPEENELRTLMRQAPDLFPSSWYRSEERVGRLRYAFQRLAGLASVHHFSVMVAVFPWLVGNGDSYPHANAEQIVTLEARREGFETVEFTQDFLRVGMEALRMNGADLTHPNGRGHRIIAEGLAAKIVRLPNARLP